MKFDTMQVLVEGVYKAVEGYVNTRLEPLSKQVKELEAKCKKLEKQVASKGEL